MTRPWDAARIAEVRARCEAATSGPLTARYEPERLYGGGDTWHVDAPGSQCIACDVLEGDAVQFAAARTDLPEALDEIERLQALRCNCDEETPGGHTGDCVTQLPAIVEAQAVEIDRLRALCSDHAATSAALLTEADRLRQALKTHEQLKTDSDATQRLIQVLLSQNESLRDQVEAMGPLLKRASDEIERLQSKEGRWYEDAITMLATAPNYAAGTFTIGERQVEIVFYQPDGKTPSVVAGELKVENERLRSQLTDTAEELAILADYRNGRIVNCPACGLSIDMSPTVSPEAALVEYVNALRESTGMMTQAVTLTDFVEDKIGRKLDKLVR